MPLLTENPLKRIYHVKILMLNHEHIIIITRYNLSILKSNDLIVNTSNQAFFSLKLLKQNEGQCCKTTTNFAVKLFCACKTVANYATVMNVEQGLSTVKYLAEHPLLPS